LSVRTTHLLGGFFLVLKMSKYTITKLDQALELEIQSYGLRVEHYMQNPDTELLAHCERIEMERRISERSPGYVKYLEETRGLV
jgi:hypothetical protein